MDSTQIDHLLNLIEEKGASQRVAARDEAAIYIRLHMNEVADQLESRGSALIPTSYGDVVLTSEDVGLTAA